MPQFAYMTTAMPQGMISNCGMHDKLNAFLVTPALHSHFYVKFSMVILSSFDIIFASVFYSYVAGRIGHGRCGHATVPTVLRHAHILPNRLCQIDPQVLHRYWKDTNSVVVFGGCIYFASSDNTGNATL